MREEDIRPHELLQTYLKLSAEDALTLFTGGNRSDIACIACGDDNSTARFSKNGFGYSSCNSCGSLFQTPRPAYEEFKRFYTNSESSNFWAQEFFPRVSAQRREAIIAPRAKAVSEILRGLDFSPRVIVDVGAGHGVFLQEITSHFPGSKGVAVEPSHEMADQCRGLGFATHEALVEDLTGIEGAADLVCSLEVLEHVHGAPAFMNKLVEFVRPGGYVFFTTLGADGFDIQVLGEHANAVFPPHHLNFLSIKGFEALCRNSGLVDIDITTPGKLDVDIVRNKLKEMPDLLSDQKFLLNILNDEEKSAAFQSFLAGHQLSSHTWVLARKPD